MKAKLEKAQAGTPKLAQSTEKGARPNKLQAPEGLLHVFLCTRA